MPTKTKPGSQLEFSTDRYLELLRAFPPRPIQNDDDHRRTIEVINGLIDRGKLTPEVDEYLHVLGSIVGDYEDSIYEHAEYTGLERLRYLMEENGTTQAQLARETGIPVQSLSDILTGKRNLSPNVRQKLSTHFGVTVSFFS